MTNSGQVWIVGCVVDEATSSWHFVGVFSGLKQAVEACSSPCHFVGPTKLDQVVDTEFPIHWPHAWYPLVTTSEFPGGCDD